MECIQNAAADMERAISKLEKEGVESYILDLRNNPVCNLRFVHVHHKRAYAVRLQFPREWLAQQYYRSTSQRCCSVMGP